MATTAMQDIVLHSTRIHSRTLISPCLLKYRTSMHLCYPLLLMFHLQFAGLCCLPKHWTDIEYWCRCVIFKYELPTCTQRTLPCMRIRRFNQPLHSPWILVQMPSFAAKTMVCSVQKGSSSLNCTTVVNSK